MLLLLLRRLASTTMIMLRAETQKRLITATMYRRMNKLCAYATGRCRRHCSGGHHGRRRRSKIGKPSNLNAKESNTSNSILSLDSEQRTRGECGGKNKYYLMAGRLWREEQVKARTYGGKNMARSNGVWSRAGSMLR
jgi:hypothetical protein